MDDREWFKFHLGIFSISCLCWNDHMTERKTSYLRKLGCRFVVCTLLPHKVIRNELALSFCEKELVLFSILIYGFSCQLTSKPAISRFRLWIKGLSWLGVKWLGSLHKASPLKCVYAVWTALRVWSSPNERQKENIMNSLYGTQRKVTGMVCT